MRCFDLIVLLGGVLLTAKASPVELELYGRNLIHHEEERGLVAKCVVCIVQCTTYVVLCGLACAPGAVFGPVGCVVSSPSRG